VYELVVYAEMPYDEVSHVLGVPVGTVKSRMSRVRQSLQQRAGDPAADHNEGNPDQLVVERPRP
jgi:DNA-directed RNA polymerase specialized sigma24 family protein